MSVSVVLTVLNEAGSIRTLLDSLTRQTRLADEVVVADGGSSDGTPDIVLSYAERLPVRLVSAPGSNISQGRNAAIRAASGSIIAATDGGVHCEPDWLACLTGPFRDAAVMAVAGFFRPDPRTVLEIAMGATVLPEARDINPATYLPSSRSVAFRREAWQAAGGYPEWLDFSEDVMFDLAVRERFGAFVFVPGALVNFRPRGSLGALARQYYQYARGDGKANLFPRLHAIRYFAYLAAAPLLIYAAVSVSAWLWLLAVLAGLAYVRLPLRRLLPYLGGLNLPQRMLAVVYVPVIRLVGDLAKMAGYPAGVWWRLRHGRRASARGLTDGHR
jgi:glycosyltransferase involved in cell wall biosynthesis